jgi:hypothetical protein
VQVEGAVTAAALRIDTAFPFQGIVAVNDNREPTSLELLVGEMRGELRGIRQDMTEVKTALADASTSRVSLHEKVAMVDKRLTTMESTVTVMGSVVAKQTTRIDKIEPVALWLIVVASGLLLVGGALWYGILNYGAAVLDWFASLRAK